MGIITDTTKARLLALEQEHGQLLAKIDTAKAEMVPINRRISSACWTFTARAM